MGEVVAAVRTRFAEPVMGTVFSFDVRPRDLRPSFDVVRHEAVAWLHWVDEVFSPYRPESEVSRLARGELTVAQCSYEVRHVIDLCDRFERETGGWFSAAYAGGIDPTGLVKGWATEQASRFFVEAGAEAVCVNGGGDVVVEGGPWRIGITDPSRRGTLATVVAADGPCAVATSGVAERGCHILDPRTHEPPVTDLASVSVVAGSLVDADAFATAAYAMGSRAREWLEEREGVEALLIGLDGTQWRTEGFGAIEAE